LADVNESPQELLKRIKHCIELGITTFDCADIYGGIEHVCEAMFGKALALAPELRASIEIVSKCGIVCPSDSVSVKHYDLSKNYILTRVNER
jgi:predicted oxidoreductase